MVGKEASFFEKHIEKIVLLVACIVSATLLFYYVFLGPCKAAVRGKNLGPSQVDDYVLKEAEKVRDELIRPPKEVAPYQTEFTNFEKKIAEPLVVLGKNLYPMIPPYIQSTGPQPKYVLPEIPPIEGVQVEHIRTVAYVPVLEINQGNAYNQTNSEPNDIDLVTVEFQFDIAALYKAFNDSFAGAKVKDQWRDKTLAEPAFAAVQLQRQQQLPDGSWQADWEDVPRSKIDVYKQLLNIVEDVKDLSTGGLQVRLLQYKERNVQLDLLQPDCYRIASAREEWFPPSFHPKYKKIIEDELGKQKRNAEQERRRTASTARGAGGAAGLEALAAARSGAVPRTAPSTTNIEGSPAFVQLYKDFDKILINDKTDLSKMTDPLTVWVFDDTVQPAKNYRYRVRLGIFNPIAGTDKFSDDGNPLKDKVILWTNFAQQQQEVNVPARLYFFAQSIEELKRRVTVLVARYKLGYWYTKDFKVTPGETIGQVVGKSVSESEDDIAALLQVSALTPSQIDYSTGQVLLDAVQMTEWAGSGNLYQRTYFEMLYSSDGSEIFQMPIGDKFWSDELRGHYSYVKASENMQKESLRPFGSGKEGIRQKILDQRQTESTVPGLKGIDTGLLELMRKRAGGGDVPQK
jgi:hypothetical protein